MSLHAAMFGGGAEGERVARMFEGLLMAEVLMTLDRFGVADVLAARPRTAAELAPEVGASADPLGRLLAAASVYQLVRRDDDGRYALTSAGELLRTDTGSSASGMAAGFLGPPLWAAAGSLAEIVGGKKADPGAPGGIYEFYGRNPDEARRFARAMGQVTGTMVRELASSGFRPLGSGRIVDVGGSRGTLLAHLLRGDPAATGVLFDRAEALAMAPEFLASAGVADRAELVTGDFMQDVPAGGDLYVLSQILHNWDDGPARTIARNCHRASRPGGHLLVIEYVLPDGPELSGTYLLDLIMLTSLGGRERTRAEHEALLGPCGYRLVRDTPLDQVLPWRILEFQHQPG
jgi:SAM-dependent methyltransferase